MLPCPVQLMLYLTMGEYTSVGGVHVMLMNLGPVLVMVMPVGYAVSEEGSCKHNYILCKRV